MADWRILSVAQGASPSGAERATVRVQRQPKLVFFPGDKGVQHNGALLGTIYVLGGNGEQYQAAGGPPNTSKDRGHSATPTPAGTYILGPQHHHTTMAWPLSVIPWGAPIRKGADGEAEYEVNGKWKKVSGPQGDLTNAYMASEARAGTPTTRPQAVAVIHESMFDAQGNLNVSVWKFNDFGAWAWNLTRNGSGTPFYVHTTVDDENATEKGSPVHLTNSHGCIHVRPNDRDEMIQRGYLKKGMVLEVKPYSAKGPP